MADEWHVVGFGKIKSNRKVICIRYVTKSQETRVSALSIKSRASTLEGGAGHGGIIGALHILKGQPLPLSFSSLLLSPSLPHLSFLSQLSGFLSPQPPRPRTLLVQLCAEKQFIKQMFIARFHTSLVPRQTL